jgi:dCMP deaminase
LITELKQRIDWDQYFMNIATQVSVRSTCDRKHVGCVIISPNRSILSTGYNGSVSGLDHCDDVGHMMEDGHCIRVVHAEQNAIAQAARNGVRLEDGICYTTASPCWICFKLLVTAGIKSIKYLEFYRDNKIFAAAEEIKIELVQVMLTC